MDPKEQLQWQLKPTRYRGVDHREGTVMPCRSFTELWTLVPGAEQQNSCR